MVSRPLCAQKSGLEHCQGPITGPSLPRLNASVELIPGPHNSQVWLPAGPGQQVPVLTDKPGCRTGNGWVQCPVRTLVSRVPNKWQDTSEPAGTQLVSSRGSQFRALYTQVQRLKRAAYRICPEIFGCLVSSSEKWGAVPTSRCLTAGFRLRELAHLAFTGWKADPQLWDLYPGWHASVFPRAYRTRWSMASSNQVPGQRLWRARTVGTGS